MSRERRGGPRYDLVLPIHLGETHGFTRNIGTGGALIVVPRRFAIGDPIDFVVDITFSETGLPARLHCTGQVRRVHKIRAQWALAVELDEMRVLSDALRPSDASHETVAR